jgi:cold shock CspA family protein
MYEGVITFVSNKGWFFAENSATHSAVFVHQNQVENNRYLKVDDRISFDEVPSTKNPGKMMAANVKYLGHIVAAQYGDPKSRGAL